MPTTTTATTAAYARRPHEGDATVWFQGCTFTFLAEAADTGGVYAVLDIEARRGCEPPPHTHLRGEQAFLVLEGAATFTCGDQRFEAPAGTFVYLPRGQQHGFEIHTETARFLVIDTPAGSEEVFRRFSTPAERRGLPPAPAGPPDEAELVAMVEADAVHGIVYDEVP